MAYTGLQKATLPEQPAEVDYKLPYPLSPFLLNHSDILDENN
jgi:hypothetical protein